MTPASRLSLLGCLLGAALALLLPGCGDGDGATAEGSGARTSAAGPKPRTGPAAAPCPARVDGFVGSLAALRRQLAVGLSYEQYAARVNGLRSDYDAIAIDRLAIACLTGTGTPGEEALNEYIGAVNAWGECLADAACTTATIEPILQRRWRIASRFLAEAGPS